MMKPYGPLAFLSLANRDIWTSRRLRWWALALIAATAAATLYLAVYAQRFQIALGSSDPVRQQAVVAHDPIRFVRLALDDYARNLPAYASQFVGNLGSSLERAVGLAEYALVYGNPATPHPWPVDGQPDYGLDPDPRRAAGWEREFGRAIARMNLGE